MQAAETEDEGDWGPLDGLPGNPMVWILILGELAVFFVLLVGFGVAASLHRQAFVASQSLLEPGYGALNTVLLLGSGWLAAIANERIRAGLGARLQLASALALGLAFIAVKGNEYAAKFAAGIGIETDAFFTLYFLITGFHALHVIAGCVGLAIVLWRPDRGSCETATAFWHVVDLLWVVIFPAIYLM